MKSSFKSYLGCGASAVAGGLPIHVGTSATSTMQMNSAEQTDSLQRHFSSIKPLT
jgi:hypothetical protein